MKKIAIIPARSGSKGLKDKNIIEICGKPMICYTIEAAIQSNCFEEVIVSTDNLRYGSIAEKCGSKVMYRNENLSNDTATTFMVIEDLLNRIDFDFNYFVLLQPTSPLRNSKHIIDAIRLFEDNIYKFDFLVSVKEAEHGSILIKPIDEDMSLKNFDEDFANYRRQNFREYSPNGAIFIGKTEKYLERKHFFGARSMAYFMDEVDSVDVDTQLDYKLASICMAERLGQC